MDFENEMDAKEHERLVDNILNLNTRQYVNKPTRTEPTAQISEYNLIKSLTHNRDAVKLHDLTRSLKNRAVHVELRKKVKKTEAKSKTLPKPLGKPQAERIKRSVAYENVKKQLDRWDSVVTSNRVSTNLSFPLRDPNFDYKEARDFTSNWVLKSNLEKELERIEPELETYKIETDTKSSMSLQQMIEKRKELEKLRRYQSYKEIKARWKNKIKSKTFRRVQRKDKIKEQMKNFELLQKTNPEEAMRKLQEIEKARAEERASLRHKSTGKWARNQQVRAKYDKESRKVLAEQLAISKDLTKKQQLNESSESENDNDIEYNDIENDDNPYCNGVTGRTDDNPCYNINVTKDIKDFVSGCNKFYENTKSENCEILKNNGKNVQNVSVTDNSSSNIVPNVSKKRKKKKTKKQNINNKSENKKENKFRHKLDFEIDGASEVWTVTSIEKNDTLIDDVFDNIELQIKNNVDKKYRQIEAKLNNNLHGKRKNKFHNDKSNDKEYLLEQGNTKSILSEEVSKPRSNITGQNVSKDINLLKSIITAEQPKPKEIKTAYITTHLSNSSNKQTPATKSIVEELFEDENFVEEFEKEKNDIQTNTLKDIDLTLPGWGSWGGKEIAVPKRKKKQFILKFPKDFPRKDMNKGNLIINESANDNIKTHLVSEVPFPFKTVKDFEASVRAPIGNSFVPETAFRKMIKPAVQTRIGSIIEPITEDVLFKKKQKKYVI